jgi:hypothetical protein
MTAAHALMPTITVSYSASGYSADEVALLAAALEGAGEVTLDGVRMPSSAGTCEVWATAGFPVAAIARGSVSPIVRERLAATCTAFGDWWARCAPTRVTAPEFVALHLEFADLFVTFDSEASDGACLEAPELRAIPSLLCEVARRLGAMPLGGGPPSLRIGIRADRASDGVAHCYLGRYWQLGPPDEEPDLIYDSWREWLYRRAHLDGIGRRV